MGFLDWFFSSDDADTNEWETYQNGYASDYTAGKISSLKCSDEMKRYIEQNIRENRPGGELPTGADYNGLCTWGDGAGCAPNVLDTSGGW